LKVLDRHRLKSSEMKRLDEDVRLVLHRTLSDILGSKIQVELIRVERAEIFLVDGKPLLAKLTGKIIPTLLFDQALATLPSVVVNMGAVPHVCNGADVMAPGVVDLNGDFSKDSIIVVVDEKYHKALAIGFAEFDSFDMRRVKQGKVVENVHYVGDFLWNLMKDIR